MTQSTMTQSTMTQTAISRSTLLSLAGFVLASFALGAGPAQAIGILVPTGAHQSLDLIHHRVEVQVTERGAKTKVMQEFRNNSGRQLEATYLFPLPKGASVDEFALWMNGKRETGTVMERGKARQIYESIVRRAQDPGLIEYVDADLFQARVFPIPPHGTQKIELIYSHLVDYEGGTHRYVYPLKTDARASSTLKDFTLTVNVKSKVAIKNLYSPTHRVAAKTRGTTAIASFEKEGFSLADDFVLFWSVNDADVGLTVLSTKEDDGAGYFMLLASPKDGQRDKEIIGKRVSFVVDTSGSMTGEKMERTKDALDYCVGQLGEDDLFNVITFGGYIESFEERMVAANPANKKRAKRFVRAIEPLGGTNIDKALSTALKNATGSKRAPHMVVFLTDGRPTIGETEPRRILAKVERLNRGGARIFVLGVGDDVNTVLLDKLADIGGGTQIYIREAANIESQIKSFYDKISHPVLSGLSLKLQGARIFGSHPRKIGDLFKGGQLVLLGRYKLRPGASGKATVTLTGQSRGGKKTFKYQAHFAKSRTEHDFIPRLWAQRQVGMLLAEIREKGESRGLVAEVTQLATRFGIVTPYTSYLVVEPGFGTTGPREPTPIMPRSGRGGASGTLPPDFGPADDAEDSLGAFAPSLSDLDAAPRPGPRKGERKDRGTNRGTSRREEGGRGKKVAAKAKRDSRARRMMMESSGEGAVRASKEIGRLRQSAELDRRRVATTMRRAMGRTFVFSKGFFVDKTSKRSDRELVIKAFSPAFFAVLRLRPDLKEAMALGQSVKVRVGKGRTLVLSNKGQENIAHDALKQFLRK